MFQPGDLIVYGRTGVCRVAAIESVKGQDFYVLTPLYQNCSIKTPVDGKVFIRPVITREEADELIDMIPEIDAQPCENKALRELTEHYQSFLIRHECKDLVELTMSIYAKKKAAEREKRKFGVVDERFLREGEALLFGELAAALDIPVDEVPGYIARRLDKQPVEAVQA